MNLNIRELSDETDWETPTAIGQSCCCCCCCSCCSCDDEAIAAIQIEG